MSTERTAADPRHDVLPAELTGVLTADPPRFDEDAIARIAAEVFGYEATVEWRFESEQDQVAAADALLMP